MISSRQTTCKKNIKQTTDLKKYTSNYKLKQPQVKKKINPYNVTRNQLNIKTLEKDCNFLSLRCSVNEKQSESCFQRLKQRDDPGSDPAD